MAPMQEEIFEQVYGKSGGVSVTDKEFLAAFAKEKEASIAMVETSARIFDNDDNGFLNYEEFTALHEGGQANLKTIFKYLDADCDKVISRDEFINNPVPDVRNMVSFMLNDTDYDAESAFSMADITGDGIVNMAEFIAAMRNIMGLNRKGDLTEQEQVDGKIIQWFELIDANWSNDISMDEFSFLMGTTHDNGLLQHFFQQSIDLFNSEDDNIQTISRTGFSNLMTALFLATECAFGPEVLNSAQPGTGINSFAPKVLNSAPCDLSPGLGVHPSAPHPNRENERYRSEMPKERPEEEVCNFELSSICIDHLKEAREKMFQAKDLDGNGLISKDELNDDMSKDGFEIPPFILDFMIGAFQSDNDRSTMNFDEYVMSTLDGEIFGQAPGSGQRGMAGPPLQ